MTRRANFVVISIAIALATAVPFLPVLGNGWLDWDDPETVTENTHLGSLSGENLAWMLTTFHMGHWHPLTWLSHALDRQVFGLSAFGSHLTNLLLHTLNAVLAGQILLHLMPGRTLAAALGALFFAIHPMRVESVAWATERRDVLSGACLLTATLLYLKGRTLPCGLAYAAACLAKAGGIGFPIVLLAIDVGVHGKRLSDKRTWTTKIPFAVLAIATAWVAGRAQASAGALVAYDAIGFLDRCRQAVYGLCWYARETAWPWPLSPIHERPAELSFGETRIWLSFVVLAIAAAVIAAAGKRRTIAVACTATYVAFLAPVLGFFQSGQQLVADRYGYLACFPFAILAARIAQRRLWAVALAALILALAGVTAWYGTLWKDTPTLMEHAVAIDPESNTANFFVGSARLAAARSAHGQNRLAEARELATAAQTHFVRALIRFPFDVIALTELGNARAFRGDLRGAAEAWQRAFALRPDPTSNAALNLEDLNRLHPELFRK